MKKKELTNNITLSIIIAIIGLVGVSLGAIITGNYQDKLYNSQLKDRRIEKKLQLIEQAYLVYGRIDEIKYLQREINVIGSDSASIYNKIFEIEINRNPVIAKYFSELLTVNKMGEIYFGQKTQELIQRTFNKNNHQGQWWHTTHEELNAITESMKNELDLEVKN